MKNTISILLMAFLFTQIACKSNANGESQVTEEAEPKSEMTMSPEESKVQEANSLGLDKLSCYDILDNLRTELQLSYNNPENFASILNKYETNAKAGIECKKDEAYVQQFERIKKKMDAIKEAQQKKQK